MTDTTPTTDAELVTDPTYQVNRWHMDVPDGRRVYAITNTKGSYLGADGDQWWTGHDAADDDAVPLEVDVVPSSSGRTRHVRIVADRPLRLLTRHGRQPTVPGRITLRDPDLASKAAPLEIDRAAYDALPDNDDVFPSRYSYQVEQVPDPDSGPPFWMHLVADTQPVPLGWSEPPDLPDGVRWVPSPAFVDLWGPVAAPHLLPGALWGVQRLVVDRVAAHPWVRPWGFIGSTHDLLDRDGKTVHFYYDRRLEGEPTKPVERKAGRRRWTVQEVLRQTHDLQLPAPPDYLGGTTAADALSRLDDWVADQVDRLLPVEGHVCGHCGGRGVVGGGPKAADA